MAEITKFIKHNKFAGTDQARFTSAHHYWLAALRQGMTLDTVWDYFVFPSKGDMRSNEDRGRQVPWLDDVSLSLTFSDYSTRRWDYLRKGISKVADPELLLFNANEYGRMPFSLTYQSQEGCCKTWMREVFNALVDPGLNLSDDRDRNSQEEYLAGVLAQLDRGFSNNGYKSIIEQDDSLAEFVSEQWFKQGLLSTFSYPDITSFLLDYRPTKSLSDLVYGMEERVKSLGVGDAFEWEPYEAFNLLRALKPPNPVPAGVVDQLKKLFFERDGLLSINGAKLLTAMNQEEGTVAFKAWAVYGLEYNNPEVKKIVELFRSYSEYDNLPYNHVSSDAFDWLLHARHLRWSDALSWSTTILERYVHSEGLDWNTLWNMHRGIDKYGHNQTITRGLNHESLKVRAFYAIACMKLRRPEFCVLSKEGTNLDLSKDANLRKVITQYVPEWKPMVRMYDQLSKSGLVQEKMVDYLKQQMILDPARFGLSQNATRALVTLPDDLTF
jgi:hypothetical protein